MGNNTIIVSYKDAKEKSKVKRKQKKNEISKYNVAPIDIRKENTLTE